MPRVRWKARRMVSAEPKPERRADRLGVGVGLLQQPLGGAHPDLFEVAAGG
ncbi:hypothetical protein [Kitasatospora sp. NPDC051914]|uniref:hypothetical protein n=1 Tax=Kitasatospora sp. NPDC051914 TaxID=3154945 RepID=UPI00342BDCC6